jgi:hypothetical protein
MKILCIIIVSFLIGFNSSAQENASNEVLVLFKSGVTKEKSIINGEEKKILKFSPDLSSTLKRMGLQESMIVEAMPHFNERDTVKKLPNGVEIRQLNMSKLFRIKVPENSSRKKLVEWLNNIPEVLFAEPNGTMKFEASPNDTDFGEQWGFENTVNPGADVHAVDAWDIYTGDPNSIIAVIDKGVDFTHEDLDGKFAGGDAGFSGYHGVAVAGIAAAESNNAQGVSGMDWHAKIHSQSNDSISDFVEFYEAITDAVDYSLNVHVLNMSFSLINSDDELVYSFVVHSALSYAYKANRTAVGVMGNHQLTDPGVIAYPGGLPTVIAVGATTINDVVRDNSARGEHIDVVAPGENIFTTLPNDSYGDEYMLNNEPVSVSGTSFAAPFVSGLASLLKGYRSNLANDDIKRIIEISADDVNSDDRPGYDIEIGHGRINAEAALNLLREPYALEQLSATGGTVYSVTGTYSQQFYGAQGIADGQYVVKRYEIRRDVEFPMPFCHIEGAWGRGVASTGWSPANPNLTEGFTEIVSGTLTNTSATLKTYIYEVWSTTGAYIGFYPTTAAGVTYAYSVLGIPDDIQSTMSGPVILCSNTAIYSLNDVPNDATIQWSSQNNKVAVTDGQGSSQATFTVNSTGIETIIATITRQCGASKTITKDVWLGGSPGISLQIDDADCIHPEYIFTAPDVSGLNYSWSINTTDLNFRYSGNTAWVSNSGGVPYGTSKQFSISVTIGDRICSYSNSVTTYFYQPDECDCGIQTIGCSDEPCKTCEEPQVVFPNPTTDEMTIATNGPEDNYLSSGPDSNSTVEIKLFDGNGELRKHEALENNNFTFSVRDLPEGNYHLYIQKGDKLIYRQIIIKR